MLFEQVRYVLQKLEDNPVRQIKLKYLQQLFKDARNEAPEELFDIVCLIIPQRDPRTYGMKETRLVEIYSGMLALPHAEIKRLKDWKQPQLYQYTTDVYDDAQSSRIDFATVLLASIESRWTGVGETMNIRDVNDYLDQLNQLEKNAPSQNGFETNVPKKKKQEEIFYKIFNNCSPQEQKWIIRIIIKDMFIGIGEDSVLRTFHPDAPEEYKFCTDLQKVVDKCKDIHKRFKDAQIQLFTQFSPMKLQKVLPGDVVRKMDNEPFYIEEKLDGFRMIVHLDVQMGRVTYFSRDGLDHSHEYGESQYEGASRRFWPCLTAKQGVKNMILDTEILVFNPANDGVEAFGTIRQVAAYDDGIQTGKRLYLVVFDVLYLNDQNLCMLPLSKRKSYLKDLIKEQHGIVKVLEYQEATTTEEIVNFMEEILLKKGEGIVVKDPKSTYIPDSRNGRWLKLKPDYISGLGEHLDAVIIGAKYGHGDKSNLYASFLVAVRDDRYESDTGDDDQCSAAQWSTLSHVGSGFTMDQLAEMYHKLQPLEMRFDPDRIPSWLVAIPNPQLKRTASTNLTGKLMLIGTDNIDVLFAPSPSSSVIVELKCMEITTSDTACGYGLRFPRLVQIRSDKPLKDSLSYTQLAKQFEQTKGIKHHILRANELDDGSVFDTATAFMSGSGSTPSKKRQRPKQELPQDLRGVLIDEEEIMGSIFDGIEVFVANGSDEHSKQDIERELLKQKAVIVQNPRISTKLVIAGKQSIKVRQLVDKKQCCIAKPSYVFDCIEADILLPLTESNSIFISDNFAKTVADLDQFDQYGDNYAKDLSMKRFEHLLKEMTIDQEQTYGELNVPLDNGSDDQSQRQALLQLYEQLEMQLGDHNFLRPVKAYFDMYEIIGDQKAVKVSPQSWNVLKLGVELFGGAVCDSIDHQTTHIVVSTQDLSRVGQLQNINQGQLEQRISIVSSQWLKDCIQERSLIDEQRYLI
ncbi:hypothetical protein MP228_009405 [Amoeboaphelidium protococcarum]|nr:hypothetical protein MP228_009405 [Amoeboaphelidium protococcarum]